jgi:ABC-type transporter Mla MlaB component
MAAEPPFELPDTLTLAEVPGIHRAQRARFQSGPIPTRIDLSGIIRSDSSALALLIDWQAQARARGCRIEFANPPQGLLVLARLSQADPLLGWDRETAESSP